MSLKYFAKFLTGWFCPVYRCGDGIAIPLNPGANCDIFIRNTTFCSLCPMFAGLTSRFFWNAGSLITVKDKGFIKFNNTGKKDSILFKKIL